MIKETRIYERRHNTDLICKICMEDLTFYLSVEIKKNRIVRSSTYGEQIKK